MLRILLIISSLFGAMILGACGKDLAVKIYQSRFDLGGLYRGQNKELIKYQDSSGFYCVSEDDLRKLIEAYKSCRDLCEDK